MSRTWMGNLLVVGLAVTSLGFAASTATAQVVVGLDNATLSFGRPSVMPAGNQFGRPGHGNHHLQRTMFVVTETHPVTGAIVESQRFRSLAEASAYRQQLSTGAWVVWRQLGRRDSLHAQRFGSYREAQQFIRTRGASRRGIFEFAQLTNETRIVPATASIVTQQTRW